MRVRFWLRLSLESIGALLGGSALYSLLMILQSDDLLGFVFPQFSLFLMLFGAFLSLGLSLGIYKTTVSLALAFGSTRREVLFGLQLFRLLPALIIPLCAAGLNALAGETALFPTNLFLPLGFGMFLGFSAIGSVLSAIFTRFGTAAALVTGLFVLVIGLGGGIVSVMMSFSHNATPFPAYAGWAVLGLGAVLYVLSWIPERRIVMTYNVKL